MHISFYKCLRLMGHCWCRDAANNRQLKTLPRIALDNTNTLTYIHAYVYTYILDGLCLIFAHLRICACVFSWLVCAYFLSWQVGVSCGIPHCWFLSFNLLYVILLLVAVLERMKLTITSNFAHQWIGKINLVEGNLKRILSYIPTYM